MFLGNEASYVCSPHKISPPWAGTFYVATHIKFPLHGRSKMSFCVVISQTALLIQLFHMLRLGQSYVTVANQTVYAAIVI